ncbi:MAG: hypothetical protein ACTJHU_07170 [Mycetocola sp.]
MRAPLTQTWPTLGAWGAGLLQIALGAAAVTHPGDGPLVVICGVALLGVGLVWLVGGGASLARGEITAPRAGTVLSLMSIGATTVAVMLAPTRISLFAVTVSTVLMILVGVACARRSRRFTSARSRGEPASRTVITSPQVERQSVGLPGLLSGALAVALVVTPALASAQAVPLGPEYSVTVNQGHHH